MAAIFVTRFDSPCGSCGHLIKEGSEATWEDEEVVHVKCKDKPLGLAAAPVCPKCFMTKSAIDTCGCDE